ncbi:MAG: response regulator [Gemmatimonadota bacterium]
MGAARVLIVDRDADSRNVYRIMLEHHGFEVVEASDGERAVEIAIASMPAIVVTELTLAQMDGHALLARLKADPATAEVCVIVLTARALREDRERSVGAGCAAFLTKPIEPQALVREINRLIQ